MSRLNMHKYLGVLSTITALASLKMTDAPHTQTSPFGKLLLAQSGSDPTTTKYGREGLGVHAIHLVPPRVGGGTCKLRVSLMIRS